MSLRQAIALSSLFVLTLGVSNADDQKQVEKNVTTITVEDMTCGGCAKKVQQYVAKVSGVEKVEPDATTHTVKVFPKANSKVSGKALWEAIEKAGYTPSKLDGPSGSFKEKPSA
jgi:copper chaperone CopZ